MCRTKRPSAPPLKPWRPLQADQAVLQARARSQFMKVLTPEQQARMKQARARAAERAQRAQRAMRAQRDARANGR